MFEGLLLYALRIIGHVTFMVDLVAMWFAIRDPNVKSNTKLLFFVALAYVILPLDLIPDFIPVFGYVDDAAAVVFARDMMGDLITDEHRRLAQVFLGNQRGVGDAVNHID
eukprot:m.54021 g.54021  ORF g.54021 m.54021 type:complete len:110 (+) comp21852_c0_seq1:332-661(+)